MDSRISLILMLLLVSLQPSSTMRVEGVAVDQLGRPLNGVTLHIFQGGVEVSSPSLDENGFFAIELREAGTLYLYADDPSTPGVDYLPLRVEAPWEGVRTLIFRPAATLVVEGSAQFIDSKELPLSTTFTVVDLEGKPIEVDGLTLIYGDGENSLTPLLGLREDVLLVPADTPLGVSVNCTVLLGSALITRSFPLVREPLRLVRGEARSIDLLAASMPLNLELVEGLLGGVSERLKDMRIEGFYLEAEEAKLREASSLLEEARYLSTEGLYIESFDAARRCYLNLKTLDLRLRHLRLDASTSIYLLLAFLSSTSTLTALLLVERWRSRLATALALYLLSLAALRWSYPGFQLLSPMILTSSSIAALSATLLALYLLSHITPKARGDGHIPVRNLIGPIISIGRRNLRRRRLRTMLTLTSLMILIASFVSLTSISTGYGLTTRRVGRSNWRGVLLRPGGVMIQGLEATVDWLLDQPGVEAVAPKAESMAIPNPHVYLKGRPIYGIVGVDPEAEIWASGLGDILIEGHLPSSDGLAISSRLAEELGLRIGDKVTLLGWTLRLEGVLSDEGLRRLREVDGSHYLPEKLVNISPEGEPPNFVPTPCEPGEVVILHISKALMVPLVSPSRISVKLSGEVDVEAFASRMALERGFKAYASTGGAVYLYQLSSYFEGRGLPLFIPWVILLLNIASITLSALRERRWEVSILSAIGLNPTQIAAVFLVEASILGFVGGGLGHLIGLSLYRLLSILGIPLSVYQKVSALWCLASLALSLSVALVGAAVALKASVILTPSLMRRWRLRGEEEAWVISIPVRLRPEEEREFIDYVASRLHALRGGVVKRTSLIRVHRLDGAYEIEFIYKSAGQALDSFYTRNKLRVENGSVTLTSIGAERWAYEVGSLMRMIAVEWASEKGSISPLSSQPDHPSARQPYRSP